MSIEPLRSLPATRREFLAQSAFGIGTLALAHLLQQDRLLAEPVGKPGENQPEAISPCSIKVTDAPCCAR